MSLHIRMRYTETMGFLSIFLALVFRMMLPLQGTAEVGAPTSGASSTKQVSPTQTSLAKTHGVNIVGFTYEDTNNNGSYDGGEPRAPYMQMYVYDSAVPAKQMSTIFSDATGDFHVAINVAKSVVLKSTAYNGYTPTATSHTYATDSHDAQLGFRKLADEDQGQLGTITGEIYQDKNGNSTKDPGEDGMYFYTLYLTDGNGNYYNTNQDTQATNNDGSFRFEHLPLGKTYQLQLSNPTGEFSINKMNYDVVLSAAQKDVSGLELPVKRN